MGEEIRTREQLHDRLGSLRQKKDVLEKNIVAKANIFYDRVTHPSIFIKECLHDLVSDSEFRSDIFKIFTRFLSKYFSKANDGESRGGTFWSSILGWIDTLVKSTGKKKNE